jgi:CheY-like chemotaxis protein
MVPTAERAPARRGGAPGPRRVLVADPHEDTARSTAWLLRLWGHGARCAATGAEALEVARAHRPDVVLMELALPGVDGCEVARRLRREGPAPALLLAVTVYGGERHRRLAREAGFDLYLVKPACPEQLRGLLAAPPRHAEGG